MIVFQEPLSIYYSVLAIGFVVFVVFCSRFIYNYRRDLFHIRVLRYNITKPGMWYRSRVGYITAAIFILSFAFFLTPGAPVTGSFTHYSSISAPLIATKAVLLIIIVLLVSFMMLSILNDKKRRKKK